VASSLDDWKASGCVAVYFDGSNFDEYLFIYLIFLIIYLI
jgi:hypothetical protein